MHRHLITILLVLLIGITACSKKKTETEYYSLAQDLNQKEQYADAISNFKKVLEYYPNGNAAPNAMFMIGFIYANNIKDYAEAKKYYTLFKEKYPQHELVKSAEFELQTLGQDTNQLPIFKDAEKDTVMAGNQK